MTKNIKTKKTKNSNRKSINNVRRGLKKYWKKKNKAELKVQCNPNTNKEKPARVTSWMRKRKREKGAAAELTSHTAWHVPQIVAEQLMKRK